MTDKIPFTPEEIAADTSVDEATKLQILRRFYPQVAESFASGKPLTRPPAPSTEVGMSPIVKSGQRGASIGSPSPLDRTADLPILGPTSMRDAIKAIPSALATGAMAVPATAPFAPALRVLASGALGFAGGGIRDLIRTSQGEQPTEGIVDRLKTDAGDQMLGQTVGEGLGLVAKGIPATKGMGTPLEREMGLPVITPSETLAGELYAKGRKAESVWKGYDQVQALKDALAGPTNPGELGGRYVGPRSEIAQRAATTFKEAGASMRKKLGSRFEQIEDPFRGQMVDAQHSLDVARDLPEQYAGVSATRRKLGGYETQPEVKQILGGDGKVISQVITKPGTVEAPFEEVRNLSKGASKLKSPMRGHLEKDLESHITKYGADGEAAAYSKVKEDYRTQIGDVFDRGAVKKIIQDPQKAEQLFRVNGEFPKQLEAIKKAIYSHPDPKVSSQVWGDFRQAKFSQMMEGGPSEFAKKLDKWDPKSVDIVFEKDAPAIYKLRDITRAFEADPKMAQAFTDLLMKGKPPNFQVNALPADARGVVFAATRGVGATSLAAGMGMSGAGIGGAILGTEVGANLLGLARNMAAYNPGGRIADLANATEAALKLGRTGPFWNLMGAYTRIVNKKKKAAESQGEPPQ